MKMHRSNGLLKIRFLYKLREKFLESPRTREVDERLFSVMACIGCAIPIQKVFPLLVRPAI